MNLLTQILYWISTGMLVPVIVLLLAAFGYALLLIGDIYGQYAARLRASKSLSGLLDRLRTKPVVALGLEEALPASAALRPFALQAAEAQWQQVHCEKALRDFEQQCRRELEGAAVLMRVGPMLGLMGTLIPMGPALVSLAAGDLSSMATNMQVAFSTTVIGLFVGAIGYVIHLVKKRWCTTDLQTLEFILDVAMEERAQAPALAERKEAVHA